jgi:hypothetical protein
MEHFPSGSNIDPVFVILLLKSICGISVSTIGIGFEMMHYDDEKEALKEHQSLKRRRFDAEYE